MEVNHTPTFIATTAIGQYLRVKLTAGKLVLAGLTDNDIGTTYAPVLEADKPVAVIPRGRSVVRKHVADGVVALHATVYTAANGKVSATNGASSKVRGIATTPATGDGSIIDVLTLETV